MPHRLIRGAGLVAIVAVLAFVVVACSGGGDSKPTLGGLASKKVTAGSIEITITPRQLDAQGARFDLVLDTHSGNLAIDVARSSTLSVGGRKWPSARWSGDGPGGHHRSGTLEFPPGGSASGPARLAIVGLPDPVLVEWPR
jgi:hypothetical protein